VTWKLRNICAILPHVLPPAGFRHPSGVLIGNQLDAYVDATIRLHVEVVAWTRCCVDEVFQA
jgi:hypothetical protein